MPNFPMMGAHIAKLGVPILDQLSAPTPPLWYSMRKGRGAYGGFCATVRRSSDNTTQAIGFVNNLFDTASALAFGGSGDVFIEFWNNQGSAGSAGDQIQATPANQAQIISAGTLITKNGRPCPTFTGASGMGYQTSGAVQYVNASTGDFSCSGVGFSNTTVANGSILQGDGIPYGTPRIFQFVIDVSVYALISFDTTGNAYLGQLNRPETNALAAILGVAKSGGNIIGTFNGNAPQGQAFGGTPATAPQLCALGCDLTSSDNLNGGLPECGIFNVALSANDQRTLVNNQELFFNIGGL